MSDGKCAGANNGRAAQRISLLVRAGYATALTVGLFLHESSRQHSLPGTVRGGFATVLALVPVRLVVFYLLAPYVIGRPKFSDWGFVFVNAAYVVTILLYSLLRSFA